MHVFVVLFRGKRKHEKQRSKTVKKLETILRDESGQGILEYVVILALVVMVGLVFKQKIYTFITGNTDAVTSSASGLFTTSGQ